MSLVVMFAECLRLEFSVPTHNSCRISSKSISLGLNFHISKITVNYSNNTFHTRLLKEFNEKVNERESGTL